MTTTPPEVDPVKDITSDATLKSIERTALVIFLGLVGLSCVFWPGKQIFFGIIAGAVIAFLNFRLIRRVVGKMVGAGTVARHQGLRFFIKLLLLLGLMAFLIVKVHVSPVAFMAGFSVIILAITYHGIKSIF